MIDIHSHIIYGVDDGAKDIEESLKLIEESYKQGVKKIIATPHKKFDIWKEKRIFIDERFEELKEISKSKYKDLEILYGEEIFYSEKVLKDLENNKLKTLAETRYILIEFYPYTDYKTIFNSVKNITYLGLWPVLAHSERYSSLYDRKSDIYDIINMGAYLQVNAKSAQKDKIFGEKYKVLKKRARFLIENEFVHFIASDMHNLSTRKPELVKSYNFINLKYGENKAKKLFCDNQTILLSGSNRSKYITVIKLLKTQRFSDFDVTKFSK